MITKQLNSQTFAWDATAFQGKGYWYILSKNGKGYARSASKDEAKQLGTPKDEIKLTKEERELRKVREDIKTLDEIIKELEMIDKLQKSIAEKKKLGESIKKKAKGFVAASSMKDDVENITETKTTKTEEKSSTVSAGKIPKLQSQDRLEEIASKLLFVFEKNKEERKLQAELFRNFSEERLLESQKRHDNLLNAILSTKGRKKTGKTITAVPVNQPEDGLSFADRVLDALGISKNAFGLLKNILKFFAFNPIGIGLLAGSTLLELIANQTEEQAKETTKSILGAGDPGAVGTEIMKQQEETVSDEEKDKKKRTKAALLADAPYGAKYLGLGTEKYLTTLGVTKEEIKNLDDFYTPYVMPKMLRKINPVLAEEFEPTKKPSITPVKPETVTPSATSVPLQTNTPDSGTSPATSPSPAGAGRGMFNPPTVFEPQPTPQLAPSTPISSRAVDATLANNLLKMEDDSSGVPVIVKNNSTTGTQRQNQKIIETTSSSIRNDTDDTAMYVVQQSLRPV